MLMIRYLENNFKTMKIDSNISRFAAFDINVYNPKRLVNYMTEKIPKNNAVEKPAVLT